MVRGILRAAVTAVLAAGAVVALPQAASASISASVWGTGGDGVVVRTGPGTSYASITVLPEGQAVTVDCQTTGTTVNGTNIWDHLPAYGGYSTDAYIYTGYDGHDPYLPLCGSSSTRTAIVNTAYAQVGNGPTKYIDAGNGGVYVPWCALFVEWVWRQNGVSVPWDYYSGDLFNWGASYGRAHWASNGFAGLQPGDAVFFGTGPGQPYGDVVPSVHVGLVVSVNGDGTINTVEGNYNNMVAAPGATSLYGYRSDVGAIYGWISPF
jgi:hypothetical protein